MAKTYMHCRNSSGKEALSMSHKQKLPVAPGNGSDPVWVGAGGSVPLGHGWKTQDTIPQPLMVFPWRWGFG